MVELKIKSCFPEGLTLAEQAAKVDEEMAEVRCSESHLEMSKEALHTATAAIGLAEKALKKAIENGEIEAPLGVENELQKFIARRYAEKQAEFGKVGAEEFTWDEEVL